MSELTKLELTYEELRVLNLALESFRKEIPIKKDVLGWEQDDISLFTGISSRVNAEFKKQRLGFGCPGA
jgi:hypothetical protein